MGMRRNELLKSAKTAILATIIGMSVTMMPTMAMATDLGEAPVDPTGIRAGGPQMPFGLGKQPQRISVSVPSRTLALYRTVTMSVKRSSGNGHLTYRSSNPSVASVNARGIVTGKATGKATITVTAAETGTFKKATASVSIRVVKPTIIASAPKSASWFSPNGSYAKSMAKKLDNAKYRKGHKGLYAATVDCDRCRLVWCYKGTSGWVPFAGYNTIQGVRDTSANAKAGLDWGMEGRLVRSRSFKGAFRIRHKRASQPYVYSGTGQRVTCRYLSCYVPYSKNGQDLCQRFEVSTHGNPDTVTGNAKYSSQGCCNLKESVAKWIYDKIPTKSTVLVFDKVNPLPGWDEADSSML